MNTRAETDSLADGLVSVANWAGLDEKAYALIETTRRTADKRELHRFQTIWVNRNDELAAVVRDLGPVDDNVAPLGIPSYWEHTVGELIDLADSVREDEWGHNLMNEIGEASTLIEDAITLSERMQYTRANRSTFGAGGTAPTIQRNGVPRKEPYGYTG